MTCILKMGQKFRLIALSDHVTQAGKIAYKLIEYLNDGRTVLCTNIRPDRWVPRSDPGHVSKAACCESKQRAMFFSPTVSQTHERRSREMRDVGDDSHECVVAFGRNVDCMRTEAGHDLTNLSECRIVGLCGGAQHPCGTGEQVGRRAIKAILLATGHGVTRHKSGISYLSSDRALHRAHIGHDSGPSRKQSGNDRGSGIHGHRHDRKITYRDSCKFFGGDYDIDGTNRQRLHAPFCGLLDPGDSPAGTPEGQAHRAADQTNADDNSSTRVGHGVKG